MTINSITFNFTNFCNYQLFNDTSAGFPLLYNERGGPNLLIFYTASPQYDEIRPDYGMLLVEASSCLCHAPTSDGFFCLLRFFNCINVHAVAISDKLLHFQQRKPQFGLISHVLNWHENLGIFLTKDVATGYCFNNIFIGMFWHL